MSGAASTTVESEFEYSFFEELFQGLNECPVEDQPKVLKAFLLSGIDTMREHGVTQLDLIEKLGALALDNVQDVRLYSLEARVKELEQGKPMTFGDILGEVFFAILLEGTLLAGMVSAAPLLASQAAILIASLRTSVRSPVMTRRLKALTKLSVHRSELVAWELRLMNRLQSRTPRSKTRWTSKTREERKITRLEQQSIRHAMEYYNRKYELMIDVTAGLPARYEARVAAKLTSRIDKLFHDYQHHVDAGKSVGRSFAMEARSQFAQAFGSSSPAAAAPVEMYQTFTTSQSVSQLIAECESLKLDVSLHFKQMREFLDTVEPDSIFDSFETILIMEELENNLFDTMDLTDHMIAHLEEFVAPMELAIWLIYLEANGVLERSTSAVRYTALVHARKPDSTRFIGDDLVESVISTTVGMTDSPRTVYDGRRYGGLHVLDEHQSYYLFHKFAKRFFEMYEDRIPKSKNRQLGDFIHRHVKAKAFDDVLGMQKVFYWTGENEERADLIREMGVVVIEYFIWVRDRLHKRETVGFSAAVPGGELISTLFASIERPRLADMELPASAVGVPPHQWIDEQESRVAAEREARILATLDEREQTYDAALAEYQRVMASREDLSEHFSQAFIESFLITPATGRLQSAQSSLEQTIGSLLYGDEELTDAVQTRTEALERKLLESPIEGDMFQRLPR